MRRAARRGLLLACAALAAGCSVLPAAPPPARYDLGPGPATTPAAPALQLLAVDAAPWLDSPAITYRLAWRDPFRREAYRDSRWAAPPAALVEQRLRQRLAGAPARALRVPIDAHARALRVHVDAFEQVFDTPAHSRVLLRLRVGVDGADGAGTAGVERLFTVERDAPSPDAGGAVRGLAAALDEAIEQLLAWAPGA